jgi:flagellar motor protein MotB
MVEVKEEPKQGVPAFMATFADLMTLLLVFFILLNVYAQQKQSGLLDAMVGSIQDALLPVEGRGGMQAGHENPEENNFAKPTYQHHDKEDGPEATQERSGDEVELRNSSSGQLGNSRITDSVLPWVFERRSAELPAKGKRYLAQLARKLQRSQSDYTVRLTARSAFIEHMDPLSLAARRMANIERFLRKLGFRQELECSARVLDSKSSSARQGQASYRAVALQLVRVN